MDKVAMQTNQRIDTYRDKIKINEKNEHINWCLTLFGTAVGAGMLFLPVKAGMSGIWAIIASSIIIGPVVYYAHRGLSRLILSSKKKDSDFVGVIKENFGENASNLVAFLYFLAFYPVLLVYGVSLTTTIYHFLIEQLNLIGTIKENSIYYNALNSLQFIKTIDNEHKIITPRWLISMLTVFPMVYVMTKSRNKIIDLTSAIVYPLIIMLAGVSIYLIKYWKISNHDLAMPSITELIKNIWITLPILVFSFNHSPPISEFSTAIRKSSSGIDQAEKRASSILRNTSLLLWFFMIFFLFSCVLSLNPQQIQAASDANVHILTYLSQAYDNITIRYIGPLIAIVAIASSFFGHYLGATEGIKGLIEKKINIEKFGTKKLDLILAGAIAISTWIVSIKNPGVLKIIEMIGTPIMAIMLYLIPMYAVYKIDAMKKYRLNISNLLVVITGLIATTNYVQKIL